MNNLSILLYLADTLPTLGSWLVFFAVLISIVTTIAAAGSVFIGSDGYYQDKENVEARKALRKVVKVFTPWLIGFILLSTLIPSQTTFYLIAGSEMGEATLKTEAAEKVGQYLDQLLSEQLSQSPK